MAGQGARASTPTSATCATCCGRSGSDDAKVSDPEPGVGRAEHPRAGASSLDDPLDRHRGRARASTAASRRPTCVFDVERHRRARSPSRTRRSRDKAKIEAAVRCRAASTGTVKVIGQRRRRHGAEAARRARRTRSPQALAKYAHAQPGRRQLNTVGPTWGHEVSQKALAGADRLLHRARALPRGPVRGEDVGRGDRRGDPRHHLHGRRVRAVPLPGHAGDRHRVPHDPRFLALRHRRRVRQGRREPTLARRRPAARTYGEMVEPLAQPGADALAVDLARRAAAGGLAARRRLGHPRRDALEDFALALAAGLFIGSYSSIFVAAPLLAWWKEREPQYQAIKLRRRAGAGAAVAAAARRRSARSARRRSPSTAPTAPTSRTLAGRGAPRSGRARPARRAAAHDPAPRPRQQRGRKRK